MVVFILNSLIYNIVESVEDVEKEICLAGNGVKPPKEA